MKHPRSKKLFEQALRLMPGGVNSPVRAFKAVGGRPLFISKAKGPRIWDADTKDDLTLSVNLTLNELGLPQKTPELIRTYVGSGVRRLMAEAVEEEEGERFRTAMRIFRVHYLSHLLDTTRLYPGMEDVLDYYGDKQKALVTNKPQIYTDRIMEGLDVTRYFDFIIGGENGIPLKPGPEMILKTLGQLGADGSRTVMIGDGVNDIHASRAAGIRVCAVGYGLGDPEELRQAGPDFFCETVKDLKKLIA